MKPTFFVAARHGEYDCDGLTSAGQAQAKLLGEAIKQEIGSCKVVIFSSPLTRAQETASIIANFFESNVETIDILKEDGIDRSDRKIELIERVTSSSVIVVVTHYEAPSGLIDAALRCYVSAFCRYKREAIDKGTALMLTIGDGTVTRLPTSPA